MGTFDSLPGVYKRRLPNKDVNGMGLSGLEKIVILNTIETILRMVLR